MEKYKKCQKYKKVRIDQTFLAWKLCHLANFDLEFDSYLTLNSKNFLNDLIFRIYFLCKHMQIDLNRSELEIDYSELYIIGYITIFKLFNSKKL